MFREDVNKWVQADAPNSSFGVDTSELHRKVRLYQSKLELSEIHSMKVEEKLKEINTVFQILGLTLEDLKLSCKTGVIKIEGQNTKNFELSSANLLSRFDR